MKTSWKEMALLCWVCAVGIVSSLVAYECAQPAKDPVRAALKNALSVAYFSLVFCFSRSKCPSPAFQ